MRRLTSTTIMANHWVTRFDPPFAQWEALLPPPTDKNAIKKTMAAVRLILQAGETEDVYRILETRGPNGFHAKAGWNYADFLEAQLKGSHVLPLFNLGYGVAEVSGTRLRAPGRVCFYRSNGALAEAEVEDLGDLLIDLRSIPSGKSRHFTAAVGPVTLQSRSLMIPPSDSNDPERNSDPNRH
jgi:hypothetical protein